MALFILQDTAVKNTITTSTVCSHHFYSKALEVLLTVFSPSGPMSTQEKRQIMSYECESSLDFVNPMRRFY